MVFRVIMKEVIPIIHFLKFMTDYIGLKYEEVVDIHI